MKNYHERKGALSSIGTSGIDLVTFGASGGMVTGSCERLDIKNSSVLVDYGLFQGRNDERSEKGERRNFTPTREIARNVRDIMITHPHIDHTGRLPKAYRDGFTPRVLATEVTATFMEPLLFNSAKIQSKENKENRLYEAKDVEKAFRYLKIVEPYKEIPIGQDHSKITVEFLPNGHVMGANTVLIRSKEDGKKQNILFTGDMGKPNQSLSGGYLDQVAKYPNDQINTLIVESTNFLNEPVSFKEKEDNLLKEITNTWKGGGTPILPVLSFHRFQEILEVLHNNQGGRIPNDCQVIIDAPLGVSLLESFKSLKPEALTRRYGDEANFYRTLEDSLDRFTLNNVTIVEEHKTSLQIAESDFQRKTIIIAGGGMGQHGRIVNYFHGDFCKNPKNRVIFTCFQVDGTKGQMLEHLKSVPVGSKQGAQVVKVEGFTSHISGPEETFAFLERFNLSKLGIIIINHGKDNARVEMANEFRRRDYDAKIIIPKYSQKITIAG
ncbi:MAG: hypothetical protein US68_C0008G0074 [Candidatus Shapirobacteria bacterium GW2011_GWE1_38_10]|uniref:RNA-metabolising metallo-beta-lactamase n=1 Tax=Candidatus Shapirobacteria bacterium GW2011_GWE1_38_10 TaxID=1618488 RepID=A0A0G0KLY6_9BACT|nr:MAG: hypothetical protein US46_C0006G0071 [Candidatus Shapirobacteria bacterium GW2011_GWF2_37_20]KKQ50189.1 MAG: hypothetical protein US68_C0008G0074 [Candidatus Shapirobacteria bacterium GW2011_GWE1_38_10]KKQ63793.1 MAG: hypothetical protein US85_C0014G0025 [Candidatus Shapirobacteria bacterium GW2011_GWF1_38_23]HBP51432.1 hypothetical protein [Candidatus Shapirobacteria bacterium]